MKKIRNFKPPQINHFQTARDIPGAGNDHSDTSELTVYIIAMKTIDATIDPTGQVTLLHPVRLAAPRKALVTILDDEFINAEALLSEDALARDWNRPEEDEAWKHFQPER